MMPLRSAWRDEHPPLGDALGAGGGDVVGLEHVEQAGAQAADQDRRDEQRHRQRRQEHRVEVAGEAVRRSRRPGTAGRGCSANTSSSMMPTQKRGHAQPEHAARPGPPGRGRRPAWLAASAASGTAISTDSTRREQQQPERRPAADRVISVRHVEPVEQRGAQVAVQRAGPGSRCTAASSGLSRPHCLCSWATPCGRRVHAQHRPRRVARDQVHHEEARPACTPKMTGITCSSRRTM